MFSIDYFANEFLLHLFLSVHGSSNIFGNIVWHLFDWIFSTIGLAKHLHEKWKD